MEPLAVEMNHIKVYRNTPRPVLDISHLAIRQGELAAVVGPNGAGKSTLLQVINLLLPYAEGELELFGVDVSQADQFSLRRRCAMAFQDSLMLNDTVFNNVGLALRFRGAEKQDIKQKVDEALSLFHCRHLAERSAQQLSGGEARRVCLARAMVHRPELLLLDEPFSSLDTPTRAALLADLKAAAARYGITVILVSHNFEDVLYLAERVLVLLEGRLVQEDRPESVLRRPANKVIADLTGMDNMIPCTVEEDNGCVIRLCNNICFPYPRSVKKSASICCLPGDVFSIGDDSWRQSGRQVVLGGVIQRIVPGIGVNQIRLDVQGLELLLRVPRERVAGSLKTGMRVNFAFDPEDAHIV